MPMGRNLFSLTDKRTEDNEENPQKFLYHGLSWAENFYGGDNVQNENNLNKSIQIDRRIPSDWSTHKTKNSSDGWANIVNFSRNTID